MTIPSAIAEALDRIERARQAAGRTDRVALELAVKTRTPDECRKAAQTLSDLGQPILLGHNRVQEAKATVDAIREVPGSDSPDRAAPIQQDQPGTLLCRRD